MDVDITQFVQQLGMTRPVKHDHAQVLRFDPFHCCEGGKIVTHRFIQINHPPAPGSDRHLLHVHIRGTTQKPTFFGNGNGDNRIRRAERAGGCPFKRIDRDLNGRARPRPEHFVDVQHGHRVFISLAEDELAPELDSREQPVHGFHSGSVGNRLISPPHVGRCG